jgi:hypothetical protein
MPKGLASLIEARPFHPAKLIVSKYFPGQCAGTASQLNKPRPAIGQNIGMDTLFWNKNIAKINHYLPTLVIIPGKGEVHCADCRAFEMHTAMLVDGR